MPRLLHIQCFVWKQTLWSSKDNFIFLCLTSGNKQPSRDWLQEQRLGFYQLYLQALWRSDSPRSNTILYESRKVMNLYLGQLLSHGILFLYFGFILIKELFFFKKTWGLSALGEDFKTLFCYTPWLLLRISSFCGIEKFHEMFVSSLLQARFAASGARVCFLFKFFARLYSPLGDESKPSLWRCNARDVYVDCFASPALSDKLNLPILPALFSQWLRTSVQRKQSNN